MLKEKKNKQICDQNRQEKDQKHIPDWWQSNAKWFIQNEHPHMSTDFNWGRIKIIIDHWRTTSA